VKNNFLIVDTSQENLVNVVLSNQNNLINLKNENKRECLRNLVPMIGEILENNNLTLEDLDFIGINSGPGSWTGLRIGYSTVKVLSLVLNIPIIEYNNFELIKKYSNIREGIILIKSSNDNYYFSEIKDCENLVDGIISEIDLLEKYSNKEKFYLENYSLEFLKSVLDEKFLNKNFSSTNDLEPYYVSTGLYKEHHE